MNTYICRYIHMYRLCLYLQLHCCPPIFVDGWRKNKQKHRYHREFWYQVAVKRNGCETINRTHAVFSCAIQFWAVKNLPWFVSIKDYTLPNYIDIHGEYSIIRYQKDSFMNQIRILWFGSQKWDFFGVFLESVHFHVISDSLGFENSSRKWRLKGIRLKILCGDERASILGSGVGRSKCWPSLRPALRKQVSDAVHAVHLQNASHEVHEVRKDFPNKRLGGGMDTMRIRFEAWVFWKGIGKMWYF